MTRCTCHPSHRCGRCDDVSVEEPKLVTVCSSCLMACCWQGIFYCDEAKTAGTVEMSVEELRALNREHPSYWEAE